MSRPNVLLVILDSVRAKNTSLHDYPIETTPVLDSLAKKATQYEQARSPGIHSIASHASIFSGYEVEEHQLFEHETKLDPTASIWPELAESGYRTGLFTANAVVTQASNLSEHFQHTEGPRRWTPLESGLDPADIEGEVPITRFLNEALRHDRPIHSLINGVGCQLRDHADNDPKAEQAATYVSEFFDWVDQDTEPWAACLNLMDAHYPYVAQPEFRLHDDDQLRELADFFEGAVSQQVLSDGSWWALVALEELYDECIKQADDGVKKLLDGLRNRGQYDDTLIVVTSDHGEAFGEYSQVSPSARLCDHSWGIHEVQTHVPLVVKYPNQKDPEQISEVATLSAFPDVVRETVDGGRESFVPESGRVLASTYRVPAPGDMLPETVNRDHYVGPWRAVYENDSSGVIKRATHGSDGATITIRSAQDQCVTSREYPGEVTAVFDSLHDADVHMGTKETDEKVEDQLEALGYMR
jgi:arylsulfatase A-like enzyme